jgi:glycosyltransferase involved in cell wall biosynthesis
MCEAMASGLPVVSFDVCAIPEFIAHNRTGLLAPPYDLQVFREHVIRLATDQVTFRSIAESARAEMEMIDIERTTANGLATLSRLTTKPGTRF